MVVSSESYPEYIGKHTITSTSNESFHVTIVGDETEEVYQFCDQDYLERVSALLNFFQQEKDDWMSPDQQILTYLFGILCVAVLVILAWVAIVFDLMPNMREVVGGDYVSSTGCVRILGASTLPTTHQSQLVHTLFLILQMTTERDSGEPFSEQSHINAYVPQVSNRKFSYPLLACDGIKKINQNNIGWTDPVHSHDFYDMSNDVAFLLNDKLPYRPVLSTIKYWSTKPKSAPSSNRNGYGSLSSPPASK